MQKSLLKYKGSVSYRHSRTLSAIFSHYRLLQRAWAAFLQQPVFLSAGLAHVSHLNSALSVTHGSWLTGLLLCCGLKQKTERTCPKQLTGRDGPRWPWRNKLPAPRSTVRTLLQCVMAPLLFRGIELQLQEQKGGSQFKNTKQNNNDNKKNTEILGDVGEKNKISVNFHVLQKKKSSDLPYVPYIVAHHGSFTHLPSCLVLGAGSGSDRKVTSC